MGHLFPILVVVMAVAVLADAATRGADLMSLVVGSSCYLLLLGAYVGLAVPSVHERLSRRVGGAPWLPLLAPVGLGALFAVGAAGTHHDALTDGPRVFAYYLASTLLAMAGGRLARAPQSVLLRCLQIVLDVTLMAALWMPIERDWVPKWSVPVSGVGGIPLIVLSAFVLALFLFLHVRRLPGIGWSFNLSVREALLGVVCFLIYAVLFGIPFGVSSGFALPRISQTLATVPHLIFYPLTVFFYTAMVEEFFFRGVIQNFLTRIFGRFPLGGESPPASGPAPWIGLVCASIIFGFAHYGVNEHKTDPRYFVLAAVAGLAYGIPYVLSRKLTPGAVTHALVDITWGLFFSGHHSG